MDTRHRAPAHVVGAHLARSIARVVARATGGRDEVTEIDRASSTPSPPYLLPSLPETPTATGSSSWADAARIAFEREYVALYRRPDRLIDARVHPSSCDQSSWQSQPRVSLDADACR